MTATRMKGEAVEALLPCPFCGEAGAPKVTEFQGEPYVPGYVVLCDASGIDGQLGRGCGSNSGWAETPEAAITAWNRRALPHLSRIPNFDTRPSIGATTPEPCLREIVHGYYRQTFSAAVSQDLTRKYLSALSSPAPEATPFERIKDGMEEALAVARGEVEPAAVHHSPTPARPVVKGNADRCTMEVGCDEYGVCYAESQGQPDRCGKQPHNTMVKRIAKALHESMSRQDIHGYLNTRIDADILAADAIAVVVGPLEWKQSNEGYATGQWFARSIFGEYYTYIHRPSGRAWLKGPGLGEFADTIDEAKAAAQADYERRIMSALGPAPVALTVIDSDAWEPCTPSYLERGEKCGVRCADAPRVWNEETKNHWHPRLQPTPNGATHRHKKRGTEYVLIGYGTFVSHDPAKDYDTLDATEVAPGVWHVRHNPTGVARIQCTEPVRLGAIVAIYRSVGDGSLWARPREEFEDGRFMPLADTAEDAMIAAQAKDFAANDVANRGPRHAMPDAAEELKVVAWEERSHGGSRRKYPIALTSLSDAQAIIEKLRAENERLTRIIEVEGPVTHWKKRSEAAEAERDTWKKIHDEKTEEVDRLAQKIDEQEDRAEAAEARLAEGMEAACRAGWERGRRSWCPASILEDGERTEREWEKSRPQITAALQSLGKER